MNTFKISENCSIECNGIEMDSETICEQVDCFVSKLNENNINKNQPIMIALDRTPKLVIAILSALEYGCPFLPIDFTMPMDRINYMISDSNVQTIITSEEHVNKFRSKNVVIFDTSGVTGKRISDTDESNEVAYVLYTSGSTGKPKGVEVTRAGLLNFIEGVSELIDFSEGKLIACLTTVSFDIFFLESIMALYKGLTVVLSNEDEQRNPKLIARLITEHNIDMIQMTPSRMQLLLNYDKNFSCLNKVKEIMIGGEPFPLKLLKTLQENTDAKIYNMYGPTETTIWSAISDLTNKDTVDIGTPIKDTRIFIIDENLNVVESGEAGEICISGKGLAKGYINNNEMTEKSFVKLPHDSNMVVYRTGDYGRYMSGGNIECLGRIDNQVKIRGYRIELEEIETVLNSHPTICQSIVTTINVNEQDKALIAFYSGNIEILSDDIRRFILDKLPEYMLPIKYIRVDEFFYTANGKIDRKKLLENYLDQMSIVTEIESNDNSLSLQDKVLKIIRENLDEKLASNITCDTDFSSIGVDSITFIKIIVSLETEFDFEFDDEMLLFTAFPYVKTMVEYVETKVSEH